MEIIREIKMPRSKNRGLEFKYLSSNRPRRANTTIGIAITYPNSQAKETAVHFLSFESFVFVSTKRNSNSIFV